MLKALMPVAVFCTGCTFGIESFSVSALANMVRPILHLAFHLHQSADHVSSCCTVTLCIEQQTMPHHLWQARIIFGSMVLRGSKSGLATLLRR